MTYVTTIISCYSPTNASDETDITTFYNELFSIIHHIPKHNIQIISADMNALISKSENNKFCLYNFPNKNGKYLAEFYLEYRFVSLIFKKGRESYGPTPTQKLKSTATLYIYKQEMDNKHF